MRPVSYDDPGGSGSSVRLFGSPSVVVTEGVLVDKIRKKPAQFFNRLGEMRDGPYEDQAHRASALNALADWWL